MEPITVSLAQIVVLAVMCLIVGATLGIFTISLCVMGKTSDEQEAGVLLSQRDDADRVQTFAIEMKSMIVQSIRDKEPYGEIVDDMLVMCDAAIGSTWR